MGEYYAAPLAESFVGMLCEAGLPAVYLGGDLYERALALASLTYKDLVVGFSPVSGVSGVARALSFARDEGAKTLACTPSLASQVARSAEYLLYAPGETEGLVPSLVGLHSLCTAIENAIGEVWLGDRSKRAADLNRAMEELL